MTIDELLALAREVLPGVPWEECDGVVTSKHIRLRLHADGGIGVASTLFGVQHWPDARAGLRILREQFERRQSELERTLGLGWVPVAERLPALGATDDEAETVDVWAGGKRVPNCYRSGYAEDWGWFERSDYSSGDEIEDVTHWRPLPAPPKEDGCD